MQDPHRFDHSRFVYRSGTNTPHQHREIHRYGSSIKLFFYILKTQVDIGETFCKYLTGSITLGSFITVGLILVISIEWYIAIVRPFN